MKSKRHLGFGSLRMGLSELFHELPDSRQQAKTNYSMHDAMMSGFACMFFQDASLLQFQRRLREERNRDNLKTLFDVKDIPEDTQMREIIDGVGSEQLRPIFKEYFFRLQRGKHLSEFQILPGLYVCSIDGTQYFHSQSIHCPGCLVTKHGKDKVSYSHKVLQAAIMHPNKQQVIPLMPEEIRNTDGAVKQDCETNAGKRLIRAIKKDHPRLGLIIVGDDLFSRQPFIFDVLSAGMHYFFVAKPNSHVYMMEWIEAYDEINEIRLKDAKGRVHVYEWVNNVPLNGNKDAIYVNYFLYRIISEDSRGNEKVHYRNSWVTDLRITRNNVVTFVRGARCRWKVENECFNTLKNQGYYIEHNYGHGWKNLCFNFFLLTLLAFYFHQIFELTDPLYQACRNKFGSKTDLWEALRSYIRILVFETWEHLLDFALTPLKYGPTCRSP
jgi:hypothetical protein